MTILKQSLIFDEALRDSPLFKAYLKGYEDRMERFEDGVTKVAQACEELSRVQSSINRFRLHFTTAFKAMSEDLISDRVLKNTVDVLNDLMESICGDIFSALQEMREHVLEAMTDIFKMHIQKIDDKKKQYYSRYDFFESNLVKGVTSSSPFNDGSRQPSESTANSRLAFKHSALELARVFNVFRIDFREQILNSFARIVKCVTGLSYKMNEKTKQIRPDIETVSSLISRALMEYKEEKDYISHRYEVYRRKCSAAMIEDASNMSSSTAVASGGSSPMVLAPSLPCLTSCNIIILQGYLMKQPRTKFGPWSRRWFYLVDDRLLYYRTKESDFKIVTDCLNKSWLIRGKKDDKRQNLLELQGPAESISGDSKSSGGGGSGKHTSMLLQAESRAESSLWQDVIFSTIQNSSSNSSPRTSYLNSSSSSELVLVDTIIKPDFNHASTIEETARLEENKYCCECSALDPCWGVTAFGITVCSSCAAVHKMAIQKFSETTSPSSGCTGRVLSLTLDEWRPEVAAVMKLLGNRLVNSIYEAHRTNELEKPRHDSDMMTREKWIFGKYLERRFVRPLSDSQSFDPSQKLFSAVSSESCDVGLLLQYISQGADVNWRSEQNDSMTPLHNATYGGKLTCCELLIQQGAEVDSKDKLGRTPLHFACINSNRMVACLLLNHGADPHALDVEEKTPMDIATDAQDRDLRCILKISQALRKFQPNDEENNRLAANAGNFGLSRAPTSASNYRGFNTER